MKIIDGKSVAVKCKADLKKKIIDNYTSLGKPSPTLAVVLVGDDPASRVYVKNKEKACDEVGVKSVVVKLDENIAQNALIQKVEALNQDKQINAILIQLPLPKHIDSIRVIEAISPEKDVDCLTYVNKGKLLTNNFLIAPCTPSGIITLLDKYKIKIEGRKIAIVGRSQLVGRPLEVLLNQRNATTILCHSKTQNLSKVVHQADIVVVAIGKPKFITSEFIRKNAVVIDVGINRVDGKLVGDVDFDAVKNKCKFITPVPGGVGPMTIIELLKNTLVLTELQNGTNNNK